MQDGPGLKIPTPEYRPQSYIPETGNIRLPSTGGFPTDPELYDNINVAHQSGLTNWWNTFIQGIQQTKQYINSSDLMDGLVNKAEGEKSLKSLENQKNLGQIDDMTYMTQKEKILNDIQKSYSDINDANSDIAKHQQVIESHPVPKGYAWNTQLAVLKGQGVGLGDYLKYGAPNIAGSSFATLGATLTSGFVGKIIKNLVTRAAMGSEVGPWGTIIGAAAGLGEVLATNAYARNLESKAEVGSQFVQDLQQLKLNYLANKPQGYQLSEDEENDLILQAHKGANTQYWKNMSLSVSDAVQSLIFAGAFGGMFKKLTNINKLSRLLGGVSEYYVQTKLEGLEEGLQQAFQYEKTGAAGLGLKDYMAQGHSIFQNYYDVLGSMKFLGFGGKGPYSGDEQFNSSVYAGSMLGALFGGSHVAFNMAHDIIGYKSAAKDLAALNPTKTDDAVLRLKDNIYAQFFDGKTRGPLGAFSDNPDDHVFYFKEGLKTLNSKLDKEGKPLFSGDELSKELSDIDKAYAAYSKVNDSIESILPAFGQKGEAKFKKTIFRDQLFHNVMAAERLKPDLINKEGAMIQAINNEQLDPETSDLTTIQSKLDVVNKRLDGAFGNYQTFLKKEKSRLTKQFKEASATYASLNGKEAVVPQVSQVTQKAINDYYDAAETTYDYGEQRKELGKVKDWISLNRWFKANEANLGKPELKRYEDKIIADNAEFAKQAELGRQVDFKSLSPEQQDERNKTNNEVLDRGGFSKSYIDTLSPEAKDIEASKILEDFKANVPRQTEDQVLGFLTTLQTGNPDEIKAAQNTLNLMLSRPSFKSTFSKLGFSETKPIEETVAIANQMAQDLFLKRAAGKKRTPLPGKKVGNLLTGREKSSYDRRETSDLKKQFNVKEGTSSQRDVLQAIIKSDFATEQEKELAKQFLEVTKDEQIEFGDLTRQENGETIREASGRFYTEGNRVVIDLNAFGDEFEGNDKNQPIETVILHELTHRYTVEALQKDPELRDEIQALIQKVRDNGESEAAYNGLKNPEEFLADAMTSPQFQAVLAKTPGTKKGTTIWEQFVNAVASAIKRVFGIDIRGSVLEQAIDITSRLTTGKKALDSVKFTEEQTKNIDEEFNKFDPTKKDATIALNDLYGQLYTEIFSGDYPEETQQGLKDYLNQRLHEMEDRIEAERDKLGQISFHGKLYQKGSYVAVAGYGAPFFIKGLSPKGELLVAQNKGGAQLQLTIPEPKAVIFNGTESQTAAFIDSKFRPEPEGNFTSPTLFKSAGAQVKIENGKVVEQTEPTEVRFYSFLDKLEKLDLTKVPYFGLLVQDGAEYAGTPIPHTQATQDYLNGGGKAGQVVIVVDPNGKPILFDNDGNPSQSGNPVVFNIETPNTILKRNSSKLAESLKISEPQANAAKQQAAEKVRLARESAAKGEPVILRFKFVSPGVAFKDIVDQIETRPISQEEAESVIRITDYLETHDDPKLKDFLYNYLLGKGDYRVSGGKILQLENPVAPTPEMIRNNFTLRKSYDMVEANDPYNIWDVTNDKPKIAASYPSYQGYLQSISNLSSEITRNKYNKYIAYDIGETLKTEKNIEQLPPKNLEEGGSKQYFSPIAEFDSPINETYNAPIGSNDLGLFSNLTTLNLVKSIDRGMHSYLRQTDLKTVGEATSDPTFTIRALDVIKKSLLSRLEDLRKERDSELQAGKMTRAIYDSEISKIDDKVRGITNSWSSIVNYYLKNSYVFSYSKDVQYGYDEQGNLVREGDDTTARAGGFDRVGNEISPIDGASKETKALVRGLPKFIETPQGWHRVLNEFNFTELNNFTVTWNNLLKNLNGIADFSDMLAKIKSITKTFPEYQELAEILDKYHAKAMDGDVEARRMIALFKRDLGKPEIPIIENLLDVERVKDEDGNDSKEISSTTFKVDEATRKNTNELKRFFLDNFLKRSPYRATTTTGDVVLSHRIQNAATSTKADRVNFLEALGFKFSPNTVTDPMFDTLATHQIVNGFKADIKALQSANVLIKDPLNELARPSKYTQGLAKRINDLLELESRYSRIAPSLSMQNVEDNTEWAVSNPNGYTIVFNAINDAGKYPSFQDLTKESQFAYLAKPYARSSHMLNQVFIMDSNVDFGKRRDAKNPIQIDLTNISGLKIEDEYGLKNTTLYIGDKLVSDFNQLLKAGFKEVMRAGDKNSGFAIRLSGYNQNGKRLRLPIADFTLFDSASGYGGEQMNHIMERYLASELARIWLGLNGHLDNIAKMGSLVKDFSLFRDIFDKDTKDNLIEKLKVIEGDPHNAYEMVEKLATDTMSSANNVNQIKKFFYGEIAAKLQSLNKYGFSFNNPYWLDDSLQSIKRDTLLRSYIVNEFIIHVEQTKLVNGDMMFYSNKNGDAHKRLPKDGATGIVPITDSWWVDAANKDPNNNLQSKLININNQYSNILNTVVFREKQTTSSYLKEWRTYLKNTGVSDKEIARITDPYSNDDIKEGDAQGWITMDFYRNFKLSIGAWTKDQEDVYERVAKGETLDPKEAETLHELFPPVKAQYAGPVVHEYYHVPGFHKFSLMPLIPSAIKDTALQHLSDRMIKHNISYALLESGSKVGTITSKGGLEPFYEDEERTMASSNKPFRAINQIPIHFLKEQVQVEPELHNEVIFGTQFRKLLFQNTYSEGKALDPHQARLEAEYSKVIDDITEYEKSKLTKELGVEPIFDNGELTGYRVADESKLVKKLQDEIQKRKLNDNIKDFFQLDNGKLKYTIDASQSHQQIRNMVMSMINNRLIRQTIKGDMLIQGSGLGHENYQKPTEAQNLEYGTNGLRFYYVKGGKTRAMQVKVPLTGDFKNLLRLRWNGEEISTLARLNMALKDESFVEDHRKMITMLGYRIPTQGLNSIEMMEVAEFLPAEAANILIVPTELVTKSGSDFDIDKLNVFKPSLRYDRDLGETTYIEKPKTKIDYQQKLDKLVEAEAAIEENQRLAQLVDEAATRLAKQPSPENAEALTGLRASLADSDQGIAQIKDDLQSLDDYRHGLFNRIIELGIERLSDPKSFKDLITPNSVDIMKPIVNNELGIKDKIYKHTTNFLSSTQEEKYLAGIPNKNALGIAAVANAFSQLLEKVGLGITSSVNHPMIDRPYSVSNYLLKNGMKKSEITSQMINAYVDVLNDDFIAKGNVSIDQAGAFFYLLHLGHDPEQLMFFFNNPVVKALVANLQRSRSLLIKNLDPNYDSRTAKRQAVTAIYDPQTKQSLKALRAQGEASVTADMFSKEHLKETLNKPLSEIPKEEKLAFLAYYLDVTDQARKMFDLQRINNYDTSTSVNPVAHEYREFIKNGLLGSGLFRGNVEDVTNKTVIKPFNQYRLISSVLDTMLPVSLNSNVRREIVSTIAEMADNFDLDTDPEKLARTFINDWLYYIYTNEGKLKSGENIGNYGRSLLFDENRLSKELLQFKTDDKWKRLRDNFPFLSQLRLDQQDKVFNISLYRDDNSTDYQNSLIEQFQQLGNFDDPTYTEAEQTEIKKFARNLAILGFTQSGLNKSPISFTDIIPNEFYVPLMDKALKAFQDLPQDERDMRFNEFASRFRGQNPQLFGDRSNEIKYYRYKDYRSNLSQEKVPDHAMSYKMPASENIWGVDTSTVAEAESGRRTATTRSFPLGKVGDIITFEGRPQRYQIIGLEQIGYENTADPKWLEQWSQKEGWTVAHFKKVWGGSTVHAGSWQTSFKKAGNQEFNSPILSSQENSLNYSTPLQEGTFQGLLRTLMENNLITPKCN